MIDIFDPNELGLEVRQISGHEAYCLCPYHNDSNASSSFNLIKGLFICYGCGTKKSASQIAKDLGTVLVMTQVSKIKELDVSNVDWHTYLRAPKAYNHKYLMSRQVTNDQVGRFDIRDLGFAICFVIRDLSGRATGVQLRTLGDIVPKYLNFGNRTAVWPMTNLIGTKFVTVVEGVFGVLRCDLHGFIAVATLSSLNVRKASRALNGRSGVIMFDDDDSGYFGAASLMMNTGLPVAIPGIEADEANKRQLENSILGEKTIRTIKISKHVSPENRFKFTHKFKRFK